MRLTAMVALLAILIGGAEPALGGLSLKTSNLGYGLDVGYGTIGGQSATGVGVTAASIGTYGVETSARGLAAGNVMLQLAIEVWGLRPDALYSLDASVLWFPRILPIRLRPYLGVGGGGGNLYRDTSEGLYNSGPQPKANAIAGIAYRAGWGESPESETMQSTWFIEVRAGQYFGELEMSELVFRQGITWLRF